jgi:hypothetical protein
MKMGKLHTRQGRKLRMHGIRGRNRKTKPKTFKSEEKAKKYAESKGIKEYKLVNLSINPNKNKIKIAV